ncbi:MAG: ATP cone domain-containing protein, partial [Clostridia bacterium]|nr:ATP cone domain-containing protein [Clostridia bacterium]
MKITKRDGREENFSPLRITRAIFLAAEAVAKEENTKADFTIAE